MNNNINNKTNSFSSHNECYYYKNNISPLTRIKVRNNFNPSQHKIIILLDSVKYIYKNEGFRGYYKGNMATI